MAQGMAAGFREAFASLPMTEQFGLIREAMQPLIDGFRELGPEGQAVANGMNQAMVGMGGMFQGLQGMGDAMGPDGLKGMFQGLGEIGPGKMDTFADSMQGVAGATGAAAGAAQALFATQKMASDVAIARLDQEIPKEKKRDGMSSKSLAKIKKMEADKEKLKKKAFEQDKKAKIAGAIMAGAMAIMQAWAVNPIVGGIMTPIIAAITAMQVHSVISPK